MSAEEGVPGYEVGGSEALEGGGGVGRDGEDGAEGEEAGGEDRVLLEALADDAGVNLLKAAEGAAGAEKARDGERGRRRRGAGSGDGGGGGRGSSGTGRGHRAKGKGGMGGTRIELNPFDSFWLLPPLKSIFRLGLVNQNPNGLNPNHDMFL